MAPRPLSHYLGRALDFVVPFVPAQNRLRARCARMALVGYEPESRRIREFVRRRGTAFDVGANAGWWTYAMHKSGLFDRIVAFEPNTSLTGDLRAARFAEVELRLVAVSDSEGTAELHIPELNGRVLDGWASLESAIGLDGANVSTVEVPTVRLDDLDASNVTFVKIDVEGHELSVLRGATALFERDRPVCMVEVRPSTRAEVVEYFAKLRGGYRCETHLGRRPLSGGNLLFLPES